MCKSRSNNSITNDLRSYIYGLLLSDGSIPFGNYFINNPTLRYTQYCKYSDWILSIKKTFDKYKILSNIRSKTTYTKGMCSGYVLDTLNYKEFKELRNIWYKEWYLDPDDESRIIYKKVVPKDIDLSSECTMNWYLGDGCIYKHGVGERYGITLATDGFHKDDVEFLCEYLNSILDTKAHITKRNTIIISNYHGVKEFLNYIKECNVPDCYSYKFPKGAF